MAEADQREAKPSRPRRRRAAAEPQFDTPDPIEIAMKAVASGADRHESARAVLEKHARLIDIQCQREREEWHVLRVQRVTRWLILAAIFLLIVAIATALWRANRSSSLVIEPFEVPPALALRGLNGRVVSARVLDRLAELQRSTESMRGEKTYANNWQDDINIAIPETGVSIGDAWRTLKGWLGEETRIAGEVVLTPDGISLTTRAGPQGGGIVRGPEAEFGRLVDEAAANLYRVTQPYRYAFSLPPERAAEREQVLLGLTADPSVQERKWAMSGLSAHYRILGDHDRALAMAHKALAIDPNMLPAIGNIALAELNRGRDEEALKASQRVVRLWRRGGLSDYDPRVLELNARTFEAIVGQMLGDTAAMRRAAAAIRDRGASTFSPQVAALEVDAALLERDFAAARAALAGIGDADQLQAVRLLQARIAFHEAVEQRRPGMARMAAGAVLAALRAAPEGLGPANRDAVLSTYRSELAIGLAQLGLAGDAGRLAAGIPAGCYRCLRAAGWAAFANGDRAGAERAFREAVRQGPTLPQAYADLGRIAMAGGDAAGGAALFERARSLAPQWTEPARRQADALALGGRTDEALRLYRRAAGEAPRWSALHANWALTLARAGRMEEARAHLRTAAALDPQRAQEVRLRRIWELTRTTRI